MAWMKRTRLAGLVRMVSVALILTMLVGCGHTILGKVVSGNTNRIELVHQSDPRVLGPGGVGNVEVTLRRDPKSAHKELVGRTRTDAGGNFTLRIKDAGAAWMDQPWLLQTYISGYRSTNETIELPPNDRRWRMIVTIAPGSAEALDDVEQIMKEVEQFD